MSDKIQNHHNIKVHSVKKITDAYIFSDSKMQACRLGKGTYGSVYKCKNKATSQICALKIVKRQTDYLREIDHLSYLNKIKVPYVLPIYQITFVEESFEIAMEFPLAESTSKYLDRYFEEHDFESYLKKNLEFTIQLSEYVVWSHAAGILHRDLKPMNTVVWRDNIYVIDFGFSKRFPTTSLYEIQSKMIYNDRNHSVIPFEKEEENFEIEQLVEYELVTLNYRPPELLLPDFDYDNENEDDSESDSRDEEKEDDEDHFYNEKIDEWSLACTIFENLTRKIAFPGSSYDEVSIEHERYKLFRKHEDKYWQDPLRYSKYQCWIPKLKDWFEAKCSDKKASFHNVYEYFKIFVSVIKSLLEFEKEDRISALHLLQYLEKNLQESNHRFITIPSKETAKIQQDSEKREKLIQNSNISFEIWWNRLCKRVSSHSWTTQSRTKIYQVLSSLISIWKKLKKNTNVFYVALANWVYWLMIIRKEKSLSQQKNKKKFVDYSEKFFNDEITKYSILAPLKMSFEYFGIDQNSFDDILLKLGIRTYKMKEMINFWEKCDPVLIKILEQSNAMVWFPSPSDDSSREWDEAIDDVLCKKLKASFLSTKTEITHKTVGLSFKKNVTDDQFRYEVSLLPSLLSKKNRNRTY